MDFLIRLVKNWTLPLAMLAGMSGYFVLAGIPALAPLKPACLKLAGMLMPVLIFLMLFFTFCKIEPRELKPRRWHVSLLLIQVVLCLAAALYMVWGGVRGDARIVWEGVLACLLCPTATAAAVVTGKLGGNAASLTTYTLESNLLSAVLITLLCPWVHPQPGIDWGEALGVIANKVGFLLILPFLAAWAVRCWLPRVLARLVSIKYAAFYLWGISLALVTAQTVRTVVADAGESNLEIYVASGALAVCCFKFAVGKAVGGHYGERISGGQALGQKNTVFAIWMAFTYLSPMAAIGPGSYVLWQNTINSYQLWKKRKNVG